MLLSLLALLACTGDTKPDDSAGPEWTMRFETADDVLLGFVGALSGDIAVRETDPTWPECPVQDETTYTTDCTDGDGYAWSGTHTVAGGVTDGVQQYTFTYDEWGWVGGAGVVSLDGAIEVTYDAPQVTQAGDTTVLVRGSPNRARSDSLPSFPVLDGEEHTFAVAGWRLTGDTESRTFGGDVTIDGTRTLRADGVYTLGGACTADTSSIEVDLVGANTATVTLDGATSCSCVALAIDGESIGEACLEE